MADLKEQLLQEITTFREAGERFLSGEMSKMEFKKFSGGFGVYAQRDQKHFMIRLRVLSGVMSKAQMKFVADMIKKHGLSHLHITTRQALQIHDLDLNTVCEIMEEGLKRNVYTRGAGGDFPRNVAMSPLSGFEEEVFDVVPYAMAANAYFLQRITTYHLPRKLKVSFSNNAKDESHATVNDLGFLAREKDGEKYFDVCIGGGLGMNPSKAVKLDEPIKAEDCLYVIAAMVKFYMAHGDYENRSKARVRYILQRMGEETFKATFKEFLEAAYKEESLKLEIQSPSYIKAGEAIGETYKDVVPQKQEGLYAFYFHPVGGQVSVDLLERLIALIEPMEEVHIRLTMSEGMYIVNLTGSEAKKVYELLDAENSKTKLQASTACIGVPTCQVGLMNSQKMLRSIIDYFKASGYEKDILPRLQISGCQNSCGVHQIGTIGLMGKMKRVDGKMCNAFEVFVDGHCDEENSRLGVSCGVIEETKIPELLLELAKQIEASGLESQTYIQTKKEAFEALIKEFEA